MASAVAALLARSPEIPTEADTGIPIASTPPLVEPVGAIPIGVESEPHNAEGSPEDLSSIKISERTEETPDTRHNLKPIGLPPIPLTPSLSNPTGIEPVA